MKHEQFPRNKKRYFLFCYFVFALSMVILPGFCIAQSNENGESNNVGGHIHEKAKEWDTKSHFDLKVSTDWAKTIEKGRSILAYYAKERANVMIYYTRHLGNPFA